jgi:hypothetical protein
MRDHYDFSKGKRGPNAPKGTKRKSKAWQLKVGWAWKVVITLVALDVGCRLYYGHGPLDIALVIWMFAHQGVSL